jgi:hypothetical protein
MQAAEAEPVEQGGGRDLVACDPESALGFGAAEGEAGVEQLGHGDRV